MELALWVVVPVVETLSRPADMDDVGVGAGVNVFAAVNVDNIVWLMFFRRSRVAVVDDDPLEDDSESASDKVSPVIVMKRRERVSVEVNIDVRVGGRRGLRDLVGVGLVKVIVTPPDNVNV